MRGYNPLRGNRQGLVMWTGAQLQPGPSEYEAPFPPNPARFGTYDRDGHWQFLKLPGIWITEFNENGETEARNRIRVDLAPDQFDEDFVGNNPPEWAIARSSGGNPYNFINKQWCCLHGKDVDYTAPSPFDHLRDERYENDEPFGLRGTEITIEGAIVLTVAPPGCEIEETLFLVYTTNTPFEGAEMIICLEDFTKLSAPNQMNGGPVVAEPKIVVFDLTGDTGPTEGVEFRV